MRGWSYGKLASVSATSICPAYAGMIPSCLQLGLLTPHLSRVCGDDPFRQSNNKHSISFVPRMRGWSLSYCVVYLVSKICPAYAGMILYSAGVSPTRTNLSRICGYEPLGGIVGTSIIHSLRALSEYIWKSGLQRKMHKIHEMRLFVVEVTIPIMLRRNNTV